MTKGTPEEMKKKAKILNSRWNELQEKVKEMPIVQDKKQKKWLKKDQFIS